jgi:hypothetical protein
MVQSDVRAFTTRAVWRVQARLCRLLHTIAFTGNLRQSSSTLKHLLIASLPADDPCLFHKQFRRHVYHPAI